MVQTVQDGRAWVFAALDHFNSEFVGVYVSTDGVNGASPDWSLVTERP
jgi:hypothetical protein